MTDAQIETMYQKGDALVLEDELSLGKYLHGDDLKKLLKDANVNLDFVFMATCHSEFAARIFLDSGAKHVIGIHKDKKIQDAAVLTFTQTFYAKLWKERSKICACFQTA